MYCLFCVVLCIFCVDMCTEIVPPGGYPIAVKYIVSYIAAGRIMSMKNFNDTVGNRNRHLPACSAVPQSTAPPRAPVY